MKKRQVISMMSWALMMVWSVLSTAQPTVAQNTNASTSSPKAKKYADDKVRNNENTMLPAINFDMVQVQGGTFQMGSKDASDDAAPVHAVKVNSFSISKYEVTQAQWKAIMHTNPSYFNHCDNCPVEKVSWNDIQEFIKKLNEATGEHYRLPTEAEWEYAARGGNKSANYIYSGSNDINSVAWNALNSNNKTHQVGQKKPNELGLYDMSGNVWEWCADWFDANYYKNSSANNPTGPNNGKAKVLRGGSWAVSSGYCHAAYRGLLTPDFKSNLFGFRLVKD